MDHQRILQEGILSQKKKRLEQLVVKNDRLVKDLLVGLSRWSDDDIQAIDTAAVVQAAQELHTNQAEAQKLDREIREAESGGS